MKYTPLMLGAIVALSACVPIPNTNGLSQLTDDTEVVVKGRILDNDGSAYANGSVTLDKTSEGEVDWGWSRTGQGAFREGHTDATGAYSFSMLGRDTKNAYSQAISFSLGASKQDGSSIFRRVQISETLTELPSMRFWSALKAPEGGITFSTDASFSWDAPADAVKSYSLSLTKGGTTAWVASTEATALTLPKYLFDDASAYDWRVTAKFDSYSARSAARSFTSPTDSASRTIPIVSVTNASGTSFPKLHDGNMASGLHDGLGGSLSDNAEFIVDLGEVKAVSRLVGYDFRLVLTKLKVFTSETQGAWTEVGSPTTGWFDLDLKGGQARYVRLLFQRTDPELEDRLFNMYELKVIGPS